MRMLWHRLSQLRRSDRGVTTVEYGLILALVALALPAVIYFTNTAIKSRFEATVEDNGGCIEETCPEYTGDNPQRIAWDSRPTSGKVGERINLNTSYPAYAFSGLPVEFVSNTPDKCTIVHYGDATPPRYELWYNHTATCTVAATQPGDITWAPAEQLLAPNISVAKGDQYITFDPLTTPAAMGSTASLHAVSMVLGHPWESGQVVQFSASGACSIDGAQTTVTYSDLPGTCTITASEPGNDDWNAASPEVQTVPVVGLPEAQTEPATNIQATSARFNGTVTANNNVGVSVDFRYCTVPTEDPQTRELTDNGCVDVSGTGAPTGTSPVAVAASTTGLSASTTYYFQVVWTYATSSTIYSAYGQFTTPAAPVVTAPGIPSITNVSSPVSGSVKVDWNAPGNDGGATVSYDIEWDNRSGSDTVGSGTTCSATYFSSSSTNLAGAQSDVAVLTATEPGLGSTTWYCVRVRATNTAGSSNWVYGGPQRGNGPVVTAPGVPSITNVSSPVSGSVKVDWNAPGNDGGATVSYDIEWDNRSGSDTVGSGTTCSATYFSSSSTNLAGAQSGVAVLTATEPGLGSTTWYCVRVRATNTAGSSNWVYGGPQRGNGP